MWQLLSTLLQLFKTRAANDLSVFTITEKASTWIVCSCIQDKAVGGMLQDVLYDYLPRRLVSCGEPQPAAGPLFIILTTTQGRVCSLHLYIISGSCSYAPTQVILFSLKFTFTSHFWYTQTGMRLATYTQCQLWNVNMVNVLLKPRYAPAQEREPPGHGDTPP